MTRYQEPNLPAIFTTNFKELRTFDRDLISTLGEWGLNIKAILDRGISLDDNLDAVVVSFTTSGTPDAENTVAHTLGKVPTYFIVADINKGGMVYRSGTAFTKTNIYVKCSVASAAVKLILL